jgi:hypothetical protein
MEMTYRCLFHNSITFFLTDKSVFLAFPNLENAIAVLWEHSNHYLNQIPFLNHKKCYFISDISPKNFEQLAELRTILPDLASLLMDKTTFDNFPQHHQTLKVATSAFPTNLTASEQALYQFLLQKTDKNCLLQKHVSDAFLKKSLSF